MIRLIGAILRRDRVMLPVWIAATGLLAYAGASGVQVEFATDADRSGVLTVALATPSLLALRGLPDGPSLGSYVYFQVFTYLCLMAGFMSTFFVTRHTRADEERGRTELLLNVTRTSPLVATLVVGVAANVVLGAAVALGFMGGGLETKGSVIAGLAAAATGVTFVALAAVVAQVAPTSRSANGISAAVVGAAFLLRAAGDAAGTPDLDKLTLTSAWPSWLSPIGWAQHVFAFTRADLTPLLLSLALALVAGAAAIVAQSRRDLGSSLLRERQGPATGRIHTTFGLAWRQQWPTIVGWAIGGALLGALGGGLGARLADAGDLSDQLEAILEKFVPGGTGQLMDLLVVAIVGIAGICAAAAGVQAILRARDEEADGRVELVLAAPVSRVGWLLGYVALAVISVVAVALIAGLVTGIAFVANGGDSDRFWSSVGAGVAQLPAALAFVAITTLIFALVPRAAVWAGWGLLVVGAIVGQFGGLLQLSDEVRAISPFEHTPVIPGADPDWGGALVVLGIAVALTVAAVLVLRRRQLTT